MNAFVALVNSKVKVVCHKIFMIALQIELLLEMEVRNIVK